MKEELKSFRVGKVKIGKDAPLFLIAGLCVLESENLAFEVASVLKEISEELKIGFIFKGSFDKANRSSIKSFRGPGLKKGLEILEQVKKKLAIPVISDVHETSQIEPASKVLDVIQIPAFLSRQTDLIVESAKTGKPLLIKKGQFLSPQEMKNVIEKAESAGAKKIILCERGTFFGYNNLVVDFRAIPVMKKFGYPVIFDATHSVQKPGALGKSTGGEREFVPFLARAAVAVGVDGIFMEVHPEPKKALSDSATAFRLSELRDFIKSLVRLKEAL